MQIYFLLCFGTSIYVYMYEFHFVTFLVTMLFCAKEFVVLPNLGSLSLDY